MTDKTVKHIDVGAELTSIEYTGEEAHELPVDSILVTSKPPTGAFKITNAYFVEVSGKKILRLFYNDSPET